MIIWDGYKIPMREYNASLMELFFNPRVVFRALLNKRISNLKFAAVEIREELKKAPYRILLYTNTLKSVSRIFGEALCILRMQLSL